MKLRFSNAVECSDMEGGRPPMMTRAGSPPAWQSTDLMTSLSAAKRRGGKVKLVNEAIFVF